VGEENFFLFGLTAEQVRDRLSQGYDPYAEYQTQPELKAAIDLLNSGLFSHGDRSLFSGLTGHLLNRDDYLVMADFEAYVDAQRQVSGVWGDPDQWTRMSVLNVSRIGYFSSDRSIAEYAEKIWKVEPTRIPNDLP
jgi:starch phosphorylase